MLKHAGAMRDLFISLATEAGRLQLLMINDHNMYERSGGFMNESSQFSPCV